jgi:hypothetical protein
VRAEVIRPGRRVQLLEGSILAPDGVELVRARALRVMRAEAATSTPAAPPPPRPEQGSPNDYPRESDELLFATDAMEIRFVVGAFQEPGPATAWFRLRRPLVAGEEPSPMQRLAAAADFGNGISAVVSWEDHVFINPDLTVYVEREPVGEWIGLESSTRIGEGGIGISDSLLYDERGSLGRATQALLVAPR